jgi:hypothetical protein
MNSPQRQERRNIRYPVHLPVLLRLAHEAIHARSDNISVGGVLVSGALPIHEGSTVEVEASLPSPGVQLSARGKVLRVLPQASGNRGNRIRSSLGAWSQRARLRLRREWDINSPKRKIGVLSRRPVVSGSARIECSYCVCASSPRRGAWVEQINRMLAKQTKPPKKAQHEA